MLGQKLTKLRNRFGYSQQQAADAVGVSRQTIANWEANQGAPALDKAAKLARLYRISLDDLVRDEVEVTTSNATSATSGPHVLESLRGATCRITTDDNIDWLLTGGCALTVRVLDVNEDWLRVEYERTKPDTLAKKETVVQLIDRRDVVCVAVIEEAPDAEAPNTEAPAETEKTDGSRNGNGGPVTGKPNASPAPSTDELSASKFTLSAHERL